jgi:hypothetical protein
VHIAHIFTKKGVRSCATHTYRTVKNNHCLEVFCENYILYPLYNTWYLIRIKLKLLELRGVLNKSKIFVSSKIPEPYEVEIRKKGNIMCSTRQYLIKFFVSTQRLKYKSFHNSLYRC